MACANSSEVLPVKICAYPSKELPGGILKCTHRRKVLIIGTEKNRRRSLGRSKSSDKFFVRQHRPLYHLVMQDARKNA
jgi:hypothetical protein